jgi:hypothetical protein
MKIKNHNIFFIALSLPTLYYVLWHAYRANGWLWHNAYNIPGFLMLAAGWPWSLLLTNYETQVFLKNALGQDAKNLLMDATVCIGFATNILLLKLAVMWAINKLKNT